MNKLFAILTLLSVGFVASSQGVVGEWNDYLSFAQAFKVVDGGEKIYCATDGGLFYYNTSDNSINKISQLNGLSDFGIKTIAYSSENKLLMVAYKNSNIDLVYENRVVNLSDIKRKTMTGDKSINNILFVGNEAYLACGFGIVVINLDKKEVKDTYLIGPNGNQINVFDLAVDNNIIFAATENGIYYASLSNPNLLDYRNWSHVDDIPHANEKFKEVGFFAGSLIAHYSTGIYGQNEVYIRKTSQWERYLPSVYEFKELRFFGTYLTITCDSAVYLVDINHQIYEKIQTYSGIQNSRSGFYPQSAVYSKTHGLWIADNKNGLVKENSGMFESIIADGPIDNKAFSLYTNENDLWVASGGLDASWNNTWVSPQFQLFRERVWNHFTKKEIPEIGNFWDIICMVADPSDKNHLFVGSWGGGLLEFKNGELQNRFTEANSSLQTAIPNQPYVRIGGLDFDSKGNLWMTNADVLNVLSVLRSNGKWESFYLPFFSKIKIGQLIVTPNDDKWIVAPRGNNVSVVNKDANQMTYLPVKSYFNNGENELITDMNDIYSIAEDIDGAIWLGTSKGVAVYFNPDQIWKTGFLYASQPGLDLKDGLYHPLLATETVTAIAVDGANRKWLGTVNSGVYLISETGEHEIHHFTQENSPLLSNTITSIAVNQKTGEVFIGTKEGIISYQGEATGGNSDFENVLVYPNPVRETYDGPVVITGLVKESDIKITDISGNLVYKTTSLGGQATWDGKTLNGNRAGTGVYLIFLTDKLGEKTHISKLLFIH